MAQVKLRSLLLLGLLIGGSLGCCHTSCCSSVRIYKCCTCKDATPCTTTTDKPATPCTTTTGEPTEPTVTVTTTTPITRPTQPAPPNIINNNKLEQRLHNNVDLSNVIKNENKMHMVVQVDNTNMNTININDRVVVTFPPATWKTTDPTTRTTGTTMTTTTSSPTVTTTNKHCIICPPPCPYNPCIYNYSYTCCRYTCPWYGGGCYYY